ncbi:MAG: response regulator [Armatimonadetes bacterium]|nr:response regulator [Armatimonadota bacterium]
MGKPLRVLIVEDSEYDVELLTWGLERAGYVLSFERVETAEAMRAALNAKPWDLVISDHSMPRFSAPAALAVLSESGLDLPFVIVSATVGEEVAVSAMKAGAHDFILKDNLTRLVPAIERELREAKIRAERREAEEMLKKERHKLAEALAELKAAQSKLIARERLHALGAMASGIAHDFNNALSLILGFSELLLSNPECLKDKERVRRYLKEISMAAADASHMVRRLREFYRPRDEGEHLRPIALNELVPEAVSLTRPRWKDQALAKGLTITIKEDYQQIPPILGNEAEFRELLTNLIFNAVDAMPEGGAIILRTSQDNEHVLLEVADTGTGMAPAVREHCLDPFFSTKGSAGTGMGLAVVHGIVRRHQGFLDIQSEWGKGAGIRIWLPVLKEEAEKREEAIPSSSRSLNILVVDDEPLLREVMVEILTREGHRVEVAAQGGEGFKKFCAGSFDLVITDLAMPEMTGDQLVAAIKRISPDTPVILATGFHELSERSDAAVPGESEIADLAISKPVTPAALRESVAKAIELRGHADILRLRS